MLNVEGIIGLQKGTEGLRECELLGVVSEAVGELPTPPESLDLSADCALMKITLPVPVIPKNGFTVEYLARELGITVETCCGLLKMSMCLERESLKVVSLSDCHGDSAAFGKEAFLLLAEKRAKEKGCEATVLPIVYSVPVPEAAVRLMKDGVPPERYDITYAIYRLYRWSSHARRVMGMNPPWLVRLNEERMLRERLDALLALLSDYEIKI